MHPIPRRSVALAVLATVATGAAVAAPVAGAASAPSTRGTTVLTLTGSAGKDLRKAAKLTARQKAARTATTVRLPVRGGSVTAKEGIVDHDGQVVLRAGKRKLAVADFRVTVRNGSTISAVVRGKRQRLFTVRTTGKQRKLNATAGTVGLRKAPVTLTATGAKLLKRYLRVAKLRSGKLGTVTVDARLGAGDPVAQPPSSTPTPPAQTPTARPVVSATLVWRQRASWMNYVDTGRYAGGQPDPQGGTTVLPPAVGHPETLPGSTLTLPYSATYPFISGWYDPATGTGDLRFAGGLHHRFVDHTIDYTATDPEIVLAGAQSQLVATLKGSGGTPFDTRASYVALDTTKGQSSSDGTTVSFAGIPGTVPAGSSSAFAGFYADGEQFGSVDQLVLTLGG